MNKIITQNIDEQDYLEIELLGNHGENKAFLISKYNFNSDNVLSQNEHESLL